MDPQMVNLLVGAAVSLAVGAVSGWLARHNGLGAPAAPAAPVDPTKPVPVPAPAPGIPQIDTGHPILDAVRNAVRNATAQNAPAILATLKALMDAYASQQATTPKL